MAAPELAQTDPEGIEGVRMSWNNWPRSKVEASKCVIPIAASIQPIRPHVDLQILPYHPLRCKTCSSVLNPYCRADFTALIWICPFCFQRNHFPQHYQSISQTNLPAELYPNFPSIEYLIPNYQNPQNYNPAVVPSPIYLFVLDTCMIEEELELAKSALKRAIGMLPDATMVGFISYGTQVQVHELGFSEMSKVYVFRGSKDLSKDQVLEQLGLRVSGGRRAGPGIQKGGGGPSPMAGTGPNAGINRFLLPASECEYALDSLLDELATDQWPVAPGNRALRCTGVALSIAVGLLGASTAGTGARIIALVGGPCTEGPGAIVSKDLSDPVRSHKDLDKDAAPYFKKAVHFYDELGKQLVSQGHVLNVFASALDQQLLINRLVGYDTILMNSLLNSPGLGYLYNYQTNEYYNLTYAHEQPESSAKFGDYLVTKCGVLMMSLFVFFTTTMSVSFTLRETQTRMLKFTVQLQHHARHRLPTFQLIFVHVIESLVFVPIMIGILFFLFEFYDDQLLAFMVLILVWICELFTLISVRTPISMKFFPRFFLLYFLVFHIYFFSYTYGFSYLALSTSAAFMQHLILYFWNRFEVPALQRFMQNRRSHFQQHPDFHITSSTILASTLRITRLNTRNTMDGGVNTDLASGPVFRAAGADNGTRNVATRFSGPQEQPSNNNDNNNNNPDRLGNPLDIGDGGGRQPESGGIPGAMSSFSSLLLWILGGASSESLNSFLSMFRDFRDQGQAYAAGPPTQQEENHTTHNDE